MAQEEKRGGARPNTGNRYNLIPKSSIAVRISDEKIEKNGGKNACILKLYDLIEKNFE
jgi:hypothetical protein